MILSHIVAAAENGTIGVEGSLPWDIPEDMRFFKDKTKNHIVIMGRKTFESLPAALPHRLNIVISRQPDYKAKGAIVVFSLDQALEICKQNIPKYGEEIFIIGGGEIYKQSMSKVDKIYLTRIYQEFHGDTKYPTIDENLFQLIDKVDRDKPIPFSFLTYEKNSSLDK